MFELPELVTKSSMPSLDGNFDEYMDKLRELEKYKGMPLTISNKNTFMAIKKSLVSLRTLVTSRKKECLDCTVKVLKSQIDLRFDAILDYIADIEGHFDEELSKEEAKRVEEVKQTLDMFCTEFEGKYGVKFEGQYPKKFFNKTQALEDSYKELEATFKAIKAAKTAYEANVELIKKECGIMVPAEPYIKMLEHYDIGVILKEISKQFVVEDQKTAKKSLKCVLTYEESKANLLRSFFKEHNIKVEVLN